MNLPINDPETVDAVAEAFEAYETALVTNDVATLQNFFWKSPQAVRYGASEHLYGYQDIADFRASRVVNFTVRKPVNLSITTFGKEFASAMFEYIADANGIERRGRQSQTWIRSKGQWRIVSAHVSMLSTGETLVEYVTALFHRLGLEPEAAWLPAICRNFEVTASLAGRLMAFSLPEECEPAPVFEP